MVLVDIELLQGVDKYNDVITDKQGLVDLPTTPLDWLLSGPNEDLEVDKDIDPSKIVDLLYDSGCNLPSTSPPAIDNNGSILVEGGEDDEGQGDGPEISEEFMDKPMRDPVLNLELEVAEDEVLPEVIEQPTRATMHLERYNPTSGQSYAQFVSCHNIATQHNNDVNKLDCFEYETAVVVYAMVYL